MAIFVCVHGVFQGGWVLSRLPRKLAVPQSLGGCVADIADTLAEAA